MNDSFCIPFAHLERTAIGMLLKAHPDAIAVSIDWNCSGGRGRDGAVVIWWAKRSDTVFAIEEEK